MKAVLTSKEQLATVLLEAREYLTRPENDFAWSSWADAGAALREIDGLIECIRSGKLPPQGDLTVLFAPTGPIQEVSLSSGWGEEFLALAKRFDAVVEAAYSNDVFSVLRRTIFG